MTDVLTVRTPYAELVELARAFAPRVDEQRIMLYAPTPVPDGAWVRFVIMLRDGSTAFEGVGRCVASLDNGPGEAPAERWDIVLEALQLEGRDEVMFERILVARESAERGDPPTGEMSIPAVDKLESATLSSTGNWSDDGDETEVAPGTDDLVDMGDVERLPSEVPPAYAAPMPAPAAGARGAPPMPTRQGPASSPPAGPRGPVAGAAVPAPPSPPRMPAPTPGSPPRAPVAASPVPTPASAPRAPVAPTARGPAAPAARPPAAAAPRPSPGLPPRPAAPPRPDGAARRVAPAPRPAAPSPRASRPDLASPSRPPAGAAAVGKQAAPGPARPIVPDPAALAALTRESSGASDAFDQDIKTLEERIAEDLHTIEIRDEDKTQQVDLTEMARRSMQEEAAAAELTAETTVPEAKIPPPDDET